jgi:uncharacterized membrane protein YidH (DUF202 family)
MKSFPRKFTRRAGIVMIVAVALAVVITIVVPLLLRGVS